MNRYIIEATEINKNRRQGLKYLEHFTDPTNNPTQVRSTWNRSRDPRNSSLRRSDKIITWKQRLVPRAPTQTQHFISRERYSDIYTEHILLTHTLCTLVPPLW